MEFTYYGHSCFLVAFGGKRLLFDPFITPNELANEVDISTIAADYILISHGHEDHVANAVELANQTGAKVIAAWEICAWLNKNGVHNTHPMNTGGKFSFDFGTVKAVVAQHSSGLPDGSYGGNPMGFVVSNENYCFYYAGDTALTLDMQLISKYKKLDVALLPIGDNFTMGYEDAITASDFIQCNYVVGLHFDTFGYIKIDKAQVSNAFASTGKQLILPIINKTIAL